MYEYEYPRPSLTADMVVTSKSSFGIYYVLLIKRGNEPFKNCWALPGGFLNMDETIKECAVRELKEETGIDLEDMINDTDFYYKPIISQVGIFDDVERDPRGRVIACAFTVDIDKHDYEIKAGDDAKAVKWFQLRRLPDLAFDHAEIISIVRKQINGKDIV